MRENRALRLALGVCMVTSAVNLYAPLYERLAAASGVGVTATTVAFACYVAGVIPVLFGLNGLAERVGYKALIVAALLLSLAATLLMLIVPSMITLGCARWLLGVAMGLVSSIAPGYMQWLWRGEPSQKALGYVTLSSALGFGLGAALTSVALLYSPQAAPWSLGLALGAGVVALAGVMKLPSPVPVGQQTGSSMLRLPGYPPGALAFGLAILLAWSTVGLVIAILPSALATHQLGAYSGFAVFGVCSAGVLFQPWTRALSPASAVRRGLVVLPIAYSLIIWGTLEGVVLAVLLGAFFASSACYGFIYLGGLSGVLARAGERTTQASAGFFLLAYIGFSLPVVTTGWLIDAFGHRMAFGIFGALLLVGSALLFIMITRQARRLAEPAKAGY
ncbi:MULTISPECIES: MFS transporter [unclassified Halomonas]|uniref:MFS transporter n=1 Tax=unclassified Halomonas TaxID=2609666 RepID=UPI002076B2AD|nr:MULTISPECIES: MFS transporter [unclassified Halomonas]